MLRRFLLPLLGFAFFATEAASAQTTPAAAAAKPVAGGYAHPVARPRALTARERRAAEVAEAAAKAEAAKAAVAVASAQTPAGAAATSWSGWGDETVSSAQDVGNGQHRPTTNLSVAPGMPINQVGHGVTTDYHGRSLRPEMASTTLPTAR